MAWSQTAPTLPDGKAWEQEQTVYGQIQTLYHMHWTARIVRLKGNQIAVHVKEWCTRGSSANASWFQPPSTFGVTIAVNGNASEEEALTAGRQYATVEWYYTGSASSGASVTLTFNDGLSPAVSVTFTAPEMDANPVRVKVSGEWKEATAVRIKVGGVWKNVVAVRIKVGGVWK